MNKKTNVEPCVYSSANSNSRQLRVRKILEWSGFATFCLLQLILGCWSTVLLLLTVVNKTEKSSLLVNLSILLALCGLVYLTISIYNSFYYGKKAGEFSISIAFH